MSLPPNGLFMARMRIQSRLRNALEKRGYQEIVTRALQPEAGSDPEIEPFTTGYQPLMEPRPFAITMHLHTSPEFAMKRLLCRGRQAIYQVCQVFRQGEKGPLHSPEFTMCEWYRTGFTYFELMQEVEAVVCEVVGESLFRNGKPISLTPPLPRLAVAEAMTRAGVSPADWEGLSLGKWRQRFQEAVVNRLEPWLAGQGALFLVDFPAAEAILSRLKPQDPTTAERFELIVAGIEIANGCTELIDPKEHRRRLEMDRQLRRERNKPDREPPERFLKDIEEFGLPPCAGVALGVDRLAMVALAAERIEQVQDFAFAE